MNTKFCATGSASKDSDGVFNSAIIGENMTPRGHEIVAWVLGDDPLCCLSRAKLLANSPEMLDALEWCVIALRGMPDSGGINRSWILENAESVISKTKTMGEP